MTTHLKKDTDLHDILSELQESGKVFQKSASAQVDDLMRSIDGTMLSLGDASSELETTLDTAVDEINTAAIDFSAHSR